MAGEESDGVGSEFVDRGRPGTPTKPLDHGQTATYDAFGCETAPTTPDGVKIATTREPQPVLEPLRLRREQPDELHRPDGPVPVADALGEQPVRAQPGLHALRRARRRLRADVAADRKPQVRRLLGMADVLRLDRRFERGLEGWRSFVGYAIVTVSHLSARLTPTSTAVSVPGDPDPAGLPIAPAGDVLRSVPEGKAIAFVGGAWDSFGRVVRRIYNQYDEKYKKERTVAYFGHLWGWGLARRIDKWNEEGLDEIIVIGHSLGGTTAVRIVAGRHSVRELRTVDPAGALYARERRTIREVTRHSTTGSNYHSISTPSPIASEIRMCGRFLE